MTRVGNMAVQIVCSLCSVGTKNHEAGTWEEASAAADAEAKQLGFIELPEVNEPNRRRFAGSLCKECALDVFTASVADLNRRSREGCTGISAGWCPVHGDCTCDRDTGREDSLCPLHGGESMHGEICGPIEAGAHRGPSTITKDGLFLPGLIRYDIKPNER